MRCVPEQKNPRAVRSIIAALLIGGGVLYAVPFAAEAAGVRVFAWLFTALTLACLVAAVFLLVRYQMTGFQYIVRTRTEAEENGLAPAFATGARLNLRDLSPQMLDFVVIRSQGARPGVMECVLGLDQLVAVTPLRRDRKNGVTKKALRDKYAEDGYVYYDYTVTFLADETLGLVFVDGNRYVGIIIEPDEAMRTYFTELKPEGWEKHEE